MSNAATHSSSDSTTTSESSTFPEPQAQPQVNDLLRRYVDLVPPVLPSASMTEKFLLTAADPAPGTRVERLERVIRTKYEAGLLKPYNYVKGYARLSRWMDGKYVDPLFQKKGVHRRFALVACRESQSSRSCNLYQSYDPSST
jgi:hypothetical protein